MDKTWTSVAGASWQRGYRALAVVAWHRAGVYVDTEVLFRDTLARNPRFCDAAYGNVACILTQANAMTKPSRCHVKR